MVRVEWVCSGWEGMLMFLFSFLLFGEREERVQRKGFKRGEDARAFLHPSYPSDSILRKTHSD